MKTSAIKKAGCELHILEDGRRYVVGRGHYAEVDEKGNWDLLDCISPSLVRRLRLAPILVKYKDLKDAESVEEIIDEDPGKDSTH